MAGSRTLIFLCRHAHPDNPAGVFYGHLPGFGLSALGLRQALGFGDFLRDFPVRHCYTSPLLRAEETARVALSRLGGEIPIELREDLVEAQFGKYLEGVKRWQVPFRRPLFVLHAISPGRLAFDEPVPKMAERIDRVCREALESCSGEAAVLVSHADPIKAFWNRFVGGADWRFHFQELAKGAFLELEYQTTNLVRITPHQPILAGAPAPALSDSAHITLDGPRAEGPRRQK